MDRRDFLELLGITGATAVAGCGGAPMERLYAYLTPPRNIVPGTPAYYATVCRACPAGCGIIVKTREARPIKLEGNPAHPVNRGALCPRGQAFIQGLYSRHRVQTPLMRQGGKLVPVSWEKALGAVAEKLIEAKAVGLMTGLESGSFEDLIADLKAQLPALSHVAYEPISLGSLKAASRLVFGRDEVPYITLSHADYVLSLGADFLDAWVSPVQFSREWADGHGFGPEGRRMFVDYVGPRRNLTATAADRFILVSTEKIATAALTVARDLWSDRRPNRTVTMLLEKLRLHSLAFPQPFDKLNRASDGVVLYGGTETRTDEATSIQATVLLANYLVGAVGRTFRYGVNYAYSKIDPHKAAFDLVDRAGAGELDALLVCGANPAYTMPGGLDAAKKLSAAKLVVALAHEHSETTDAAHVVLPIHHPLESWGDYEVMDGVAGMMQPVRAPLYDSRHAGDVLIDLARRTGRTPKFDEYKKCVTARWAARSVTDLHDVLTKGGIFDEQGPPKVDTHPIDDHITELHSITGPWAASGQGEATLVTPMSAALHDGRDATHDWLFETPDSLTQATWEVPIEISGGVAAPLGVKTGDRVKVSANGRSIVAAAYVDEDLAPMTVAVRFGGGRRFIKEAFDHGSVMLLLGAVTDPVSGDLAYVQTKVTVAKAGPGDWATVSGGTDSHDRFLCLSADLKDARAGVLPILTRHGDELPEKGEKPRGTALSTAVDDVKAEGTRPGDNMYDLTKHPEHRWGLIVDLDRCTGCGACVVACYAENNIPVVGRAQIIRGRELAWMRIEKHVFAREAKERRVRFLPVMCQHCAQAPCETVCPVFASYHTPDGLNAQVYNRCIGTRYCANNCPYKVRRFNWFDWARERPQNEQLNPDVTVRSRGVMEKCTLCIQRIREATNRAKFEGRPLRDREINPACAQTCPTGALTFGDLKRPDSAATRLANDARGYRLLDYQVNTRPGVVYLRKVYSDVEAIDR